MTVSRECRVCSDRSDGLHFGVDACRACAAFFRRSVALKKNYVCRHGQDTCIISKSVRCMCRSCRFQKCLQAGMQPDAVQQQRDQIGKRNEFSPSFIKRESPDTTFGLAPEAMPYYSSCASQYNVGPADSCVVDEKMMPRLSRIRDGYLRLKSQRLTYDLEDEQAKNLPKPRAVNERYCSKLLLHDQKFIREFIDTSFERLAENLLYRSFLPIFIFFESGYVTNEICPEAENVFILSDGNYIDAAHMETFYVPSDERDDQYFDAAQAVRLFHASFQLFTRNVHQPMRFLKMTLIEFAAVCALMLFSHGIEGETEATEQVAKAARDEIFTELSYYYKYIQGMTDYALRLGNLMLVLPALQRVLVRYKEDLEMGKLFNVRNFDREVYNLMVG